MTEEEKIKDFLKFCAVGYSEDKGISFEGNPFFLAIRLIEKLEEENEELNNRDTSRLSEIGRLRTKNSHLENEIKYYYIPKDKIRELFKELYIIEESKYAKIKTIDSDKAFKFVKDIEKLLEEE